MEKQEDEVGAVPTIEYEFTAIPTKLMMMLDNNCRSMLFTLIQLSSYYSESDGYFYRSNELLQLESSMSKNLVIATMDTLYMNGIVDIKSIGCGKGKKTNRIKINFNQFKKYEEIKIDTILNDPTKRIRTVDYKWNYSPSYLKVSKECEKTCEEKCEGMCEKVNTNIDNIKNKNNKENNNIINNIKENIIRKQEENNHDFVNASSYLVKDDADDVKKDTSIEEIPFINKAPNAICASVGADITSNNEESEQIPTCTKENSDTSTKRKEISITPTSDKECCMAKPTVSPIELLEEAKKQLQLAETFGELEDAFLKYKPQMKEFGGFYFKSLLNCQQECEKKFYHSSTEQYSGIGRLSFPI